MVTSSIRAAGAIALLMGSLGCIGWIFGIPALEQILQDGASMKLNTSICVVSLGLALLLPKLRNGLGTLVLLIGITSLLEFASSRSFGIDQLLVADHVTAISGHPGRTSPSTAFAVCLIASSLFFVTKDKKLGQWLSLLAVAVSADAIVIHAYSLGLSAVDTGMALQTGIGVLSAAIASSLLNLGEGPLASFASTRQGGRLSRRLLPSLVLAIVICGWVTAREISATNYHPGLWIAAQTIATCTCLAIAGGWYAGKLNEEDAFRENVRLDLEKQIDVRTAELAEANRELQTFVHSISHDIRGSLRTILASSSIVLEDNKGTLNEESMDWLRTIQRRGRSLEILLEDLLRYTKVSGAQPVYEEVDLTNLAKNIADDTQNLLNCKIDVEENLTALADPNLLRLIMTNLIENACKYSRESSDIKVGRTQVDNEEAFFVRDFGRGFEMKYASDIFEPLKRLVRDSEVAGSGMGLANVSRAVERHGGRIWVISEPEKGTTFFFTLASGI